MEGDKYGIIIGIIIAVFLIIWTLYDTGKLGFTNNDLYYMTGEEQHTYPILIHNVKIPSEW